MGMRQLIQICATGVLLATAACGAHHGGDDPDASVHYDSIRVEPAAATLTVALGGTQSQTYQVIGQAQGQDADITSRCVLGIDSQFGSSTAATVTVGAHGGVATVTASCDALSGSAQLTVNVTGTLIVGTNTPANAADLFGAATLTTDASRSPGIEYPIDQAVAPRNIPPIEVQWTAASDDLFHIALTSSHETVDVYTSDLQATLSATDWDAVAGTAAGEALSIVVEGLAQAAPSTKYASTSRALVMSHDTIDTSAIYYWASSQGSIMTQTFGAVDAPTVVKDNCSGCHSLSRAGTRIGYSRCVANQCGPEYIGFLHYDATAGAWTEVVNADAKALAGSYTTFSPVGNPFPDDTQSVAMVTLTDGSMGLYDPDTGAAVASNLNAVSRHSVDGTGSPTNRVAMMPDWSADGTKIVFASTPNAGSFVDLDAGSIATMSYAYTAGQHTFGEPQPLVTPPITLSNGSYENLFFPSFSPDNKLVVFNAARSGWRRFDNARAPGQRLVLADAGGAGYVDLSALNGGNVDTNVTWPHWAPGNTSDYYWIVFSSERDYGHEITTGHTAAVCVANGVKQCKQIWISAISKAQLAAGLTIDPSAPPMWLPGQDPQADNISPYWTKPAQIQ